MKTGTEKYFTSDFTFGELNVGMLILNAESNQASKITALTSNSVEVFNTANKNSIKSKKEVREGIEDGIEAGKLKGIDSKNWYTMDTFNRTFKRL